MIFRVFRGIFVSSASCSEKFLGINVFLASKTVTTLHFRNNEKDGEQTSRKIDPTVQDSTENAGQEKTMDSGEKRPKVVSLKSKSGEATHKEIPRRASLVENQPISEGFDPGMVPEYSIQNSVSTILFNV